MNQRTMENTNKLIVATTGRLEVIPIQTLVRIEAISNYSRLYLVNGKTILVAKVLKRFEEQLDHGNFIRTHKTHLVNLEYIQSSSGVNKKTLMLSNGDCIAISRSKQKGVLKRLLTLQAV